MKLSRKTFGASATVALASLAGVGIAPRATPAAYAQTIPAAPAALAVGPLHVGLGERGLIALLLPAVQKAQTPFRLRLLDSAGQVAAELPIPPPPAGARYRTAYFEFYQADGSVRIAPVGRPNDAVSIPGANGMLIGLLLPAVQREGKAIGPISGSVELFGDGSVRKLFAPLTHAPLGD